MQNPCSTDVCQCLAEPIRTQQWAVEIGRDIAWIFLREPGFKLTDFGDVGTRNQRLGKWIVQFPTEQIISEAKRVLPLIHAGQVKLAKVTNTLNRRKPTAVIVVYCLDRDAGVLAALRLLGWEPRWKYNYETFENRR